MKTAMLATTIVTLAASLCGPTNAIADTNPAVERFIGCPVYRDTDAGRKSGCWLVTNPADGRQYDVTDARLKPILGQQILVEGVATAVDGELCGGIVLRPVDVSVLQQTCKAHVIPAEGHPGRRFALPTTVLQPTTVPRVLPPPPYTPRQFTIEFELNSDFLVYQYAELIIEQASLYAKASQPRRIVITGYAATHPVDVSGQRIAENIEVGEARARMIAEALSRLGIPRDRMELRWLDAPDESTSLLPEASRRRATIVIEPE